LRLASQRVEADPSSFDVNNAGFDVKFDVDWIEAAPDFTDLGVTTTC
jgi:hypothetical protein